MSGALRLLPQRTTPHARIASGLPSQEGSGGETLIAYAAKFDSAAKDGDGEHSPFTAALLRHLAEPGLDIRLAFGRVRDEVMKATNNEQEPFVYGSLGGSTIALVPGSETSLPVSQAFIKSDYDLVERINKRRAWEVFIDNYKTGFYVELAKEKLAAFEEPPKAPKSKATKEQEALQAAKEAAAAAEAAEKRRVQAAKERLAALEEQRKAIQKAEEQRIDQQTANRPEQINEICGKEEELLAKLKAAISEGGAWEGMVHQRELKCEQVRSAVEDLMTEALLQRGQFEMAEAVNTKAGWRHFIIANKSGLYVDRARQRLRLLESAATEVEPVHRVALVIGNTKYTGSFEALMTPSADAHAIADALQHLGLAAEDVVEKYDLDRKGLIAALRDFEGKARAADWAIVYFAGHGVRANSNLDYLIPIDAVIQNERDLADDGVPLSSVVERIRDTKKLQLVIFDACRDNQLSRRLYSSTYAARGSIRSASPIEAPGLILAFSARRGQSAADGSSHSPFAEALLKQLGKPNQPLDVLFTTVADQVRTATNEQQAPEIFGLEYAKSVMFQQPTVSVSK